MNNKELEFILRQGEGQFIEFKESGDILIEVFRNKIIISNSGGLVKWLKEKDFGKYSRARNQLIAELLSKTEYVEKLGTGINRMKIAMKTAGLLEPSFDYNFSFSITLLDYTEGLGKKTEISPPENLTDLENKILIVIKSNPKVSRQKISKNLNIGEDTVKEYLDRLKQKKILERIGPDKGGYWKILKKM